uniref:malate dehydrogenase n=1 Tax=Quercus lobata TaxID=97700 RepID=A0A7N2LH74_QUELO
MFFSLDWGELFYFCISYAAMQFSLASEKLCWQIGYAIVPMIARGIMLGPDQPVILHLLDTEQTNEALNSLKMELLGSAFPLLKQVVATSDNVEACKDVNIAIMIAGYSRKDGLDTKDLMSKNVSIYKDVASVLEQHAAADCKVLVVTNPANTNALILKQFAPSIPEENITCLTRLDHNIALSLIAEKVKVPVSNVKNIIIWGNHYANQYPDINHATVTIKNEEKPVKECIPDDHWNPSPVKSLWLYLICICAYSSLQLKTEFITNVQQRGAAWNRSQKATNSALSCASAACDHIHDWVYGTPKGKWVSMGVYSDGSYGIPKDIIYSFPVKCEKGKWSIVQGLTIDALTREKMDLAAKDLEEEISMAKSCLD